MLQPYPQADAARVDAAASGEMAGVMAVIRPIRPPRSERDIAPSKPLPVLLADGGEQEHTWMQRNGHYLKQMARTESVHWLPAGEAAPESAMQLVGNMKVLVPLGAFINKQEELARIRKEIEKFEKELAKAKAKLANQDFVARAPAQVVEQEKGRVAEFEAALAKLSAQCAQVEALAG